MKKALILGITGQDGSYLSEHLLNLGYQVHGVMRRSSSINTERIDHIFDPESKQFLHYGDLEEGIEHLLYDIQPDEVYNLAAMSQVAISFQIPVYTGLVNGIGALKILEAIKKFHLNCKYYQASSSEMFGLTPPPQNELSPFNPVSPYGCAKLYAYHTTKTYRTAYNMFACNGILFNHESPRRGVNFVTRKITIGASRIYLGLQDKIKLGNLNAVRDWGHSKDYMRAIHMIMQHDKPDDFVVATGESHTVFHFLEQVFHYLELPIDKHVEIVDSYFRPNEVPALEGDASKIRDTLGWMPEISFGDIVKEMVENDLEIERNKSRR